MILNIIITKDLSLIYSGVPAVVDLAAMRDAIKRLGGDPSRINPLCPVDLVIDHSVQVDIARTADAREQNEKLEFDSNKERFHFHKWGSEAFENFRIFPQVQVLSIRLTSSIWLASFLTTRMASSIPILSSELTSTLP